MAEGLYRRSGLESVGGRIRVSSRTSSGLCQLSVVKALPHCLRQVDMAKVRLEAVCEWLVDQSYAGKVSRDRVTELPPFRIYLPLY